MASHAITQVIQSDLFGDIPTITQTGTTAIYPNRMADKLKVEGMLALPEKPCGQAIVFRTPKGTVLATDYIRVVYGDHGPYVEFRRDQIKCALIPRFGTRPLPPDVYYEWLVPMDGSGVKVYDQKRDVKHIRNAPAGGFAGNRAEGYADYIPGMIYVSPWELRIEFSLSPKQLYVFSMKDIK